MTDRFERLTATSLSILRDLGVETVDIGGVHIPVYPKGRIHKHRGYAVPIWVKKTYQWHCMKCGRNFKRNF